VKIWNVRFIRLKCSIRNSTTLKSNSFKSDHEREFQNFFTIRFSIEGHRKTLACFTNNYPIVLNKRKILSSMLAYTTVAMYEIVGEQN